MPPTFPTEPREIVPLCVDLDGTLIRTDVLWESLVQLLKKNPRYGFAVPFWFLRGRAHLKSQIAARVRLDAASLPYDGPLLDFLRLEKDRGRQLLLVSAADSRLAECAAQHVNLFSEVLASDGKTNLRGKTKGAKLAERFGERGFDYIGNSSADLPVWKRARQAMVVNGSSKLAARASRLAIIGKVFGPRKSRWGALVQVLRLQQWVGNLVVFLPLLISRRLADLPSDRETLLAWIALGLGASGVFILRELLNVEADRHQPAKRLRPFASGDLPLSTGLVMGPILLTASALLASRLPWGFCVALGIYLVLAAAHPPLNFRRGEGQGEGSVPSALVDVLCRTGLYTICLIAGHDATGISFSFWPLFLSILAFLTLALVEHHFLPHDSVLP